MSENNNKLLKRRLDMNVKRLIIQLSLAVMLLAIPIQQVFGQEVILDDLIVRTDDSPTISLDQTDDGFYPPYNWQISGNEEAFFIKDTALNTEPFRIEVGAPYSSLFVEKTGEVGIGTEFPDARLHVVASSEGAVDSFHLENTTGPARLVLENGSIENTSTNDKKWIFNSNGTLRLSAGDDGAEFKLDADGNLTILGSLTTGSDEYPDYVFKDNYPLMPLNDLNKFIENEGHLPNIASAEEVKKAGGVNMTELQIKLLEKVEEVTLYTLKQEARIDTQQAMFDDQQKVIDTLKQEVKALKQ
jgi:hypothetical protein